jgi:hypothetical protein
MQTSSHVLMRIFLLLLAVAAGHDMTQVECVR